MPAARCSSTESARFSLNCSVRLPSPRDFRCNCSVRLPSPRDPRCNCCVRLPSPLAFLLAAWWESAKTVDSRERRRLILFVYVLGGKYLLYTAGSYIITGISSRTHSFIPDLKPPFCANSSYRSLLLFFFRTDYMDSPDCLLLLLSISICTS